MQIAEQILQSGVSGSGAFCDKLRETVAIYGITRAIETGTHEGLGTTRAILEALEQGGEPFEFYSIEVNPTLHRRASTNLGRRPGLHLVNGLSVSRSLVPVDTTFSVPDHVVVDHYPEHRAQLYTKEVSFDVVDDALDFALAKLDYLPQLVLLDSAGHMGWIEFRYLMERARGSFILALDDTGHVKHYDTMQYIKSEPGQFEVLWEVESININPESGSKFGSALVMVKEKR